MSSVKMALFFNLEDEDEKRVYEYLNTFKRKKSQRIIKLVLKELASSKQGGRSKTEIIQNSAPLPMENCSSPKEMQKTIKDTGAANQNKEKEFTDENTMEQPQETSQIAGNANMILQGLSVFGSN